MLTRETSTGTGTGAKAGAKAPSSVLGRPSRPWVPIRSLAPRHARRVLGHLLALGPHDRYLRFGYPASDTQIAHYVENIAFGRDEVYGIVDRRLELIGVAHLAYGPGQDRVSEAEFGVSVAERARGRQFGSRLFDHAVLHARNRGVDRLVVHALSENTAMLRIARASGARVVRQGSETEAVLELPRLGLSGRLQALLGPQAAELDYGWKVQAKRVGGWLELAAEVHDAASRAGRGDNG